MKIYIEYDGAKVKCSIENTFSNKPHRIVAFNDADKMSQIFALGAFRNIEQTYKRKQKKMTVNELIEALKEQGDRFVGGDWVRRQLLDDFKAACAARGDRVNTVLREAMENYVNATPTGATAAVDDANGDSCEQR